MVNAMKMDTCANSASFYIYRILLTVLYISSIHLALSSTAQDNGAENGASKNTRSLVTLQDNGYRNMVIAINERVPEDPNLIERIKMIFTDASRFLYKATK